ncbi:transposase [Alloprevotella sp. Lung230]|uniref:transposase n=1 Tax=Alloprevotella sp. Lung230 TaxID=2766595 RepID=UPI00351C9E40
MIFRVFIVDNQTDNDKTILYETYQQSYGKLYADKGYISQSLFASLFDRGVHIVTEIRTNMKNRLMDVHDKIMLRKRSIIETINDMLKNVAQIVHTRHRSISNFIVNLLAGMAAYAFYDTRPSINMEFEMEGEAEVKQLTLF